MGCTSNDTTDINGVVTDTAGITGTNAYHVVYLDGTGTSTITTDTVLDGFTITAGHAHALFPNDNDGGGLFCSGGFSGSECSPALSNVVFSGNLADRHGGGMFNAAGNGGASNPVLTDVTFSGNQAGWRGGGMYNDGWNGGTSSPMLTNVTFSGNHAIDGGGMYSYGHGGGVSSPTLTSVTFSNNQADSHGGGMFNNGDGGTSSPTLTNVTFSDNQASRGGGMQNYGDGGTSSAVLTNVTFSGNHAVDGGGMYNNGYDGGTSSPTLTSVTFSGNQAASAGGGILNNGDGGTSSPALTNVVFSGNQAGFDGGGVHSNGSNGGTTSPVLTNVTFSGNHANRDGGGMFNYSSAGTSSPTLTNVILWDNTASSNGAQIYNDNATPTISYSDIEGSGGSGAGWDSSLGADGGHNMDADPLFVDSDGADDIPGTLDDDLHLQPGSPCIDAGTSVGAPSTDFEGDPRPWGLGVDMGADEYYREEVDIPLQVGWNHISLPLDPLAPYTAEGVCSEINSQGGDVAEIDRWYASGWDGHICGLPFNDFDVELGSDYFIRSNAVSTWTIEGYSVTTPVPLELQVGWNSIGIPHTDAYTAESLCDEINAQCGDGTAVEVDRWYASGWDGHICGLPFNDFAIEIGKGYFVKASDGCAVTPSLAAAPPAARPLTMPKLPEAPWTARKSKAAIAEVKVTNARDTSFTVSWGTDVTATGWVNYGTSPALGQTAYDDRGAKAIGESHHVTLHGLSPQTIYYFEVVSGAVVDDHEGSCYQVTTGPTLELPASHSIYGRVFESDGVTPAEGAIVYITLRDVDGVGSPGEPGVMSALVDADGWWQANLGNARLADGIGYFTYSAAGDTVMLVAEGVHEGFVSRTVDTSELGPVAPLTLVRQRRPYLPLVVKE
ncbi:MAG: fibronectin type III domain-containing protein [Anaerolineales bacterium]|nr:fibronectin type III domain-containing protein [Anaerolineales bacterium]